MEHARPLERGPKDIFLDSLQRCDDSHGDFLERFYERFMASAPAVAEAFRFTDLSRQRRMMRRSLGLIARAAAGEPDGLRELHERAETHGRAKLDIDPSLYRNWLDTLIVTAAESDPEWTPDVESAWRAILGIAIRHMTINYDA